MRVVLLFQELFRHLSTSSSALSGSENLGKSLIWWRYGGCTILGSWETCPHAVASPRCRGSGAPTHSPGGGQEPSTEIPWRCRVLQGSGSCSDAGGAANRCQQTLDFRPLKGGLSHANLLPCSAGSQCLRGAWTGHNSLQPSLWPGLELACGLSPPQFPSSVQGAAHAPKKHLGGEGRLVLGDGSRQAPSGTRPLPSPCPGTAIPRD